LNKLSKHQDARSSENRAAFQAAEKEVAENIGKLEILKPRISQGYERYQKILLEQALRNAARQGLLHKGSPNLPEVSNETLLQQGPFGNARPLSPGKNRWIAVELAHGEERRRKRLRKDPPRLEPLDNSLEAKDNEDLRTLMQETRNRIDGKGFPINKFHSPTSRDQNSFSRHQNPRKDSPIAYSYPSVPRTGSDHQLREDQEIKTDQTSDEDRFTVPAKPPKEYFGYQSRSPKLPPKSILPDEFPLRPDKIPIIPSSESGSPTGPEPDSSSYTFNPTATLENGTALRTVFLPPTLRATFLSYALPNTKANLETCGILCGTLISNALFISKLVIPEQESTSDTCETVNESELFDYCDQEDLMVLGWIHTHPTQTCFMSSRDLHTHCGYQVMMPESIAIVCAPRQNPS
jgi:STAM-binding protein